MKYFTLNGDLAHLAGKKVQEYFKKATYNQAKPDPNMHVHREFVRDVLKLFADKTEIQFSQACMIAQCADLSHARAMHQIAAQRLPLKVKIGGKMEDNPIRIRLRDLGELSPHDHREFMKRGWIWATTLIHPHSKPLTRGSSDISKETEMKIVKRIFKHADETREAHQKRTAEALARALNNALSPEKVSERLDSLMRAAE